MAEAPFSQWAVVELFGHQRIAGLLTEQTIGGCHFLRVDVPECEGQKAYTKLYGQGAIYAINFVEEPIARELAKRLRPQPVQEYEISNLLPPPRPPSSADRFGPESVRTRFTDVDPDA